MIKLGVDNGNYNTKSSQGMLYASGYTVSDREFITPEMQLFCEGRYYAVGERRLRFQQTGYVFVKEYLFRKRRMACMACRACCHGERQK